MGDFLTYRELDDYFNIDEILRLEKGAVIIDLAGTDIFYAEAANSDNREKLANRIKLGEIIPVNADAMSDLASNHSFLHARLYGMKFPLPTIPTTMKMMGQVATVGNYIPKTIPNLFVHKKSGAMYSHGGAGVSMVLSEKIYLERGEMYEIAQPFVIPPADENKERFVTDTRVFLVGGEPAAFLTRKASKPLTQEMLEGKKVPTGEYYPTADHPGEIISPTTTQKKLFGQHAKLVYKTLSAGLKGSPNRLYSDLSTLGFASMDYLLDSKGVPLLVDFDLQPMIRDQVVDEVANALYGYLTYLARNSDGSNKTIIVLSSAKRNLIDSLSRNFSNGNFDGGAILQKVDFSKFSRGD